MADFALETSLGVLSSFILFAVVTLTHSLVKCGTKKKGKGKAPKFKAKSLRPKPVQARPAVSHEAQTPDYQAVQARPAVVQEAQTLDYQAEQVRTAVHPDTTMGNKSASPKTAEAPDLAPRIPQPDFNCKISCQGIGATGEGIGTTGGLIKAANSEPPRQQAVAPELKVPNGKAYRSKANNEWVPVSHVGSEFSFHL